VRPRLIGETDEVRLGDPLHGGAPDGQNLGIGGTREKLKALMQRRSEVAKRTEAFISNARQTREGGGLHPPYLLLAGKLKLVGRAGPRSIRSILHAGVRDRYFYMATP
jgi:hypothetical protein